MADQQPLQEVDMVACCVFHSLKREGCSQKTGRATAGRIRTRNWELAAPLIATLMAGTGAAPALAADTDRTRLSSPETGRLRVDGNRWAARFDVHPPAADDDGIALRRPGWQLLGDYYFSTIGGLRATGGLLGSPARPATLASGLPGANRPASTRAIRQGLGEMAASGRLWHSESDTSTATYLGLGYSVGNPVAGWGLSADLGLRASRETAEVRLGQSDNTSADWPQTLRLRPMLQFGVSYSF